MIEKITTTVFRTRDGQKFETLQAAEDHEFELPLTRLLQRHGLDVPLSHRVTRLLLSHRSEILMVLTPTHSMPPYLNPQELKVYQAIADFDQQLNGVSNKILRRVFHDLDSYDECIDVLVDRGYVRCSDQGLYRIKYVKGEC